MRPPLDFYFDFSSPYGHIVDGEPFRSVDCLDQVERWLGAGGL
jgi:hypothetical protein